MSNLPQWKCAEQVYQKAYRVLQSMADNGHVRKGIKTCYPSDEMNRLVKALNIGDEGTIKGLLLMPEYFRYQA